MITKRQLEDAARCREISCLDCSAFDICPEHSIERIDQFAQTALAYREILEQLEWVKCPGHEDILYCSCCGGLQIYGHKPDCELAALLKESEGEEG